MPRLCRDTRDGDVYMLAAVVCAGLVMGVTENPPPDDLYFDLKAGWQGQFTPTGEPYWGVVTPDVVRKLKAYVEVPHELLAASDPSHACGPACPAEPPPRPPLTRRRRARLAVRRFRRRLARLGGLRIAHRDRIDRIDQADR